MYDKANRPPPAGSLQEALFLTVWLKRQDAEAHRMALFVAGVGDIALASVTDKGGNSASAESYKKLMQAMFPYAIKEQASKDAEMKQMMAKEVAKGMIRFDIQEMPNPLVKRAKELQLPDDFKKKLRDRSKGPRKD